MCYPSDPQKEGKFIPQWCMWYVLEVYEYLTIRKPKFSKEFFKPSVYGVVDLMLKYLNDDGLLECLPSWNFVEWSKANWWTNDVNFPTQFLFSEVLDCTAKLYGDSKLFAIADNMRKKAIELSFDGEFFVDHAVRDNDGALTVLTDTSEAAQYYALLFGKIDFSDNKYDKFKDRVFNVGYDKVTDRDFVQVNAFIGFYLKQLALLKYKKYDLLEKEIKNFFAGQVQKTGTLWEYKTPVGSNDHGFASFAVISADIIDKLKNK
jgi:alpha-L-rhamnosidase